MKGEPIAMLRAIALVWAAALCPVSALLLAVAVTPEGRVFALGALLLGMVPALAWMKPENTGLRRGALAALVAWMGIAIWLCCMAPDGRTKEGARVENRYSKEGGRYRRNALGTLLPEVDQFMLGFRLLPAVDPLLTMRQVGPLAQDTREIYAELEADEDFHALGSALPQAYNELWSLPFDHGHYYLYRPRALDAKTPAPVLVFLHGSGGNFKSYTWLLSKIADEQGMVLIAPTCGFGNWEEPRATQMVVAALEDVAKTQALDMGRVHLAGLSNGSLGVSRIAASAEAARFRSLIFLSPVCDDKALVSSAFAEHWQGRPLLVITGEEDDRVPVTYVKQCVEVMRKAKASVTLSVYPQTNHFLVFSHREQFLKELSEWVGRN
jgi:predicted esterase